MKKIFFGRPGGRSEGSEKCQFFNFPKTSGARAPVSPKNFEFFRKMCSDLGEKCMSQSPLGSSAWPSSQKNMFFLKKKHDLKHVF